VQIRQAVRVVRDQPFEFRIGGHAEVVCWGVMPSGMLRHPLFSRWSGDRPRPPRNLRKLARSCTVLSPQAVETLLLRAVLTTASTRSRQGKKN